MAKFPDNFDLDYITSGHLDRLKGGRADAKNPKDFNPFELNLGIQHESEHTSDPYKALEIAMDHLAEDPKYYTNLSSFEKITKSRKFKNESLIVQIDYLNSFI